MNVFFESLGCDKNLVDSEFMLGLLDEAGFTFTNDETVADVIVINTCAFINDAKEESINSILELAKQKEEGKCIALIVTGCLAQRYKDEFSQQLPEVDAVIGTNSWDDIVKAIKVVIDKGKFESVKSLEALPDMSHRRILSGGMGHTVLKIAEGCNKGCTYCIIPSIRGKYRSIPIEKLISQAKDLTMQGISELILVAQETTLYGVDIYGEKCLHKLLKELSKIDGIKWIRLLYCYPEEIYDELIDEIRTNDKVCHYIDMPIQHINDDILRRMGRLASKDKIINTIKNLREKIPDIAIRTTVICGFPGEKYEQHLELVNFLKDIRFDRLGAFAYSQEENTPAAVMDDQIDENTKAERVNEIMSLQKEICTQKAEELIGKKLLVTIDGKIDGAYIARTYKDAPDVDGYLFLESDRVFNTGDFAEVIITGANEYDLYGELI